MKKLIAIILSGVALCSYAQSTQTKQVPYRTIRTLTADLNNDGKIDTIKLISSLKDWNSFDKISISLTGYGRTVFKAHHFWTVVDSDFLAKNKNGIHTKLLFFKKTPVHAVILLFGELGEASYRGDFSVINIENNKVKMAFDPFNKESDESDVWRPTTLTDLKHDGRLDFVYNDGGEFYEHVPGGDIGTYHPYYVYPVFDECKIDTQLTKSYNQEHYVYAGLDFGKKIEIFYPSNNGKPKVWKGHTSK